MTTPRPDLATAFEVALRQVDRALDADLRTRDGAPAHERLAALRHDIERERDAAVARGGPDPEWVARIVRDVASWTPETELALLAALGGIHRAARPSGH